MARTDANPQDLPGRSLGPATKISGTLRRNQAPTTTTIAPAMKLGPRLFMAFTVPGTTPGRRAFQRRPLDASRNEVDGWA